MTPPACHWIRSVLAAYLAGEMKSATAEAVRRHLAGCEACRELARQHEETWGLLDDAPPPVPVSPDFTARMMARVVEEKELQALEARLRPSRRRREIFASLSGLAAGLALGLALYGWAGLTREPNSPVEREVCRSVTFLEDAELMDEMAVIEAMDRLTAGGAAHDGT